MLNTVVPLWSALLFAAAFWLLQYKLKRHVRLWSLVCFPSTLLHEFAHGLVGLFLGAKPASFSLWPKRVSATGWRLGYVSFSNLRWWNAGPVGLAPLLWALPLVGLVGRWSALQVQYSSVSLRTSALVGASVVWAWLAIAPSASDWQLAAKNWLGAAVFMTTWAAMLYCLLTFRLVL